MQTNAPKVKDTPPPQISHKITRESLKERFRLGLQRWREGWDFDSLCSSPTRAATGAAPGAGVSPESDSASPREEEQSIPKETLNYCEDALSLYWLASGLLGAIISNTTHQPGQNMFSGFNYGDMLKSARTFTRTGEGVPVKLRNLSASHARNERHPSAGPPVYGGNASRNPHMPPPTSTSAPSSASASSGPPSNPPASSSFDPSTHSSSHSSTIPTSVSPPDQASGAGNAGNDEIINQDLSSLAEGMSDGTFAGIMRALTAGSGDLSMQLGLINEQGEGEGEGEGVGEGAEGGNEGNGGGEESLQGLSDQDIAKQLGFMI
ncbi:hypothetical protein B9479_008239 [Cryptococcus floricola]|uniref:Uncharacterized protein n=1 Tax=Cryptococcus floricola TaxID=2591691 RepID=A0A5D3AJM2_9TREE|nr:hypothetical protein B9479_008239 [Cryptococcus floricola]